MKTVGIFLLTVLSFIYLATFPIFAQEDSDMPSPTAAVTPTPKPKTSLTPTPTIGNSLATTPTVTPKLTQPVETTTPTPKLSPTSTPPTSPTETVQDTPTPVSVQANEIVTTPTPTPQPVVISRTTQPVLPLGRIITAPFDLVTNYLPRNYYNNQGLASQTTQLLLILSFLCVSSGIGLLQWPSILKAKSQLFAPSSQKRNEFPIYSQKN